MSKFDEVTNRFERLPYMSKQQAEVLRELIVSEGCRKLLEIGFYHGKSTAYLAAILDDLGSGGIVTIDRQAAKKLTPTINQVLAELQLTSLVTARFAERSHTWELARMLQADPLPQFDFCYFDGGHTWDVTGFGFYLVDALLKPGGVIVFDDLHWTPETAMKGKGGQGWATRAFAGFSDDEKATASVGLVFDMLVPRMGYSTERIYGGRWGLAKKPRKP